MISGRALGVALTAAAIVALVTAAPYVLVRAGLDGVVGLPVVDAAHVSAGVVLVVYLAAKVRIVGRRAVWRSDALLPRERWLGTAVGVAYAGTVATGVAALVRLDMPARAALGQAHLILAVWASALALLHTVVHRRHVRARAPRPRARSGALRRGGVGAATIVLVVLSIAAAPVVAGAAIPAAASQLAAVDAGATWSTAGPAAFLDAAVTTGSPPVLVVGGAGLFVVDPGGPRPSVTRTGSFDSVDPVLSLSVVDGRVWAGAASGLYAAAAPSGPYRLVSDVVTQVHAVAADPDGSLWCTATGGVYRSSDGGRSWKADDGGIRSPSTVWALAAVHGVLYLSDATAVYRRSASGWVRSSDQRAVVSLAPAPGAVLAGSMGAGVWMLRGGRWRPVDDGLPAHLDGPVHGVHVVTTTALQRGPVIAGLMVGGAASSVDGGRHWVPVWPQLGAHGVVWRVLVDRGWLWAVTDGGLWRTPLSHPSAPSWWWWPAVAAIGLGAGAVGATALVTPGGSGRRAGRIGRDGRTSNRS